MNQNRSTRDHGSRSGSRCNHCNSHGIHDIFLGHYLNHPNCSHDIARPSTEARIRQVCPCCLIWFHGIWCWSLAPFRTFWTQTHTSLSNQISSCWLHIGGRAAHLSLVSFVRCSWIASSILAVQMSDSGQVQRNLRESSRNHWSWYLQAWHFAIQSLSSKRLLEGFIVLQLNVVVFQDHTQCPNEGASN